MVTEGKAIFSAKGTKQDVVRPLYFGLEYTIGDFGIRTVRCEGKVYFETCSQLYRLTLNHTTVHVICNYKKVV